jgi:O-antigen/teichoic acid export membrane protein
VYYSTAAEYVRERAFPRLAAWHRRWAFLLTAVTVPGFAVAGLIIAHGLPLLGAQWLDARVLVVPACLYWGSQFFGLPLSQTLLLVGRIRLQLVWTVVQFAAAVAAFALWPVWGAVASIWAWSIVCVATNLVLTVVQGRVLRVMAGNETTPAAQGAALVS